MRSRVTAVRNRVGNGGTAGVAVDGRGWIIGFLVLALATLLAAAPALAQEPATTPAARAEQDRATAGEESGAQAMEQQRTATQAIDQRAAAQAMEKEQAAAHGSEQEKEQEQERQRATEPMPLHQAPASLQEQLEQAFQNGAGGHARPLSMQLRNTAFGTQFGKNKVTYDAFDFWVYSAPHFDVYYYPEEEAQLDEIVAFAENAYNRLSRKLNHELSERTPIIFYQTHSEFQQTHVIPLVLPEGVAAFAEPVENRLVLPADDPPDELYRLMVHEITHIFEYDFLYGGQVGRALRLRPPNWVMEGFAEHVADGLTTTDQMLLRDVVLADQIPTLLQMSFNSGFFVDYVLGQVVFDYIAEEYGDDGLRIFLGEVRRDLGQDIERDLERAFNVTPQEFNNQFRDWLRARYLPDVLAHDEAEDFGLPVFAGMSDIDKPVTFSPTLSPEGDEFVAISVNRKKLRLDLMRFDLETGEVLRNLSDDVAGDYEYIIGQGLTVGFSAGHDLSWSPSGDAVAFFGRTGPTRTLFLVDPYTGDKIHEKRFDELDQAMSPSIGPDGRVAFGAHQNGVRDIWLYDPSTEELINVTQDDVYDYAPIWSPDGRRLVFATHYLRSKKLFMVDLTRPQERVQLTFGPSNDTQPSFSRDGSTLYFSSDRGNIYNVYSMDLASGVVSRLTDILHGAFFPHPIPQNIGKGDLLFSSYGEGRYELFTMDTPQPFETYAATDEALSDEEIQRVETELAEVSTVELDQDNISQSAGGGWHISNVQVAGGISAGGPGNTVLSSTAIEISDLLGNHRIVAVFGSVSSQRNLSGFYYNQKNRVNWGASGTSQRFSFFTIDRLNGNIDTELAYGLDGGEIFASYPFSRDYRVELSAGFYDQTYRLGESLAQTTSGQILLAERFHDGTFTPFGIALVADKARFREFGPFAGRRLRLDLRSSPGFGNNLQFNDVTLDYREYIQLTERSLIATRFYGSWSEGTDPNVFFIGGLNQLRGFRWLQFSGNRAAFMNVEYRFPFIDEARGGDISIRDIRGLFFFDMGATWFDDQNFNFWQDGRLADAVSSFGGGIALNLGPLPLNFYVSQQTDLGGLIGDIGFDFYIGPRF